VQHAHHPPIEEATMKCNGSKPMVLAALLLGALALAGPAVAADTVKIGVMFSTTGAGAVIGVGQRSTRPEAPRSAGRR
jgi:hypothetical protein